MSLDFQRLQTLTERLLGANYNTLAGLSKALFTYLENEAAGNPEYAAYKNQIPSHAGFKSANGATDGGFWTLPENPDSLAFALFYWIAHREYYPMHLYPVRNFNEMASTFVADFTPHLADALNKILSAERTPETPSLPPSKPETGMVQHHTHFHAPVGNVVTSPQNSTIHQSQTSHGVTARDLTNLLDFFREAKIPEPDLIALQEAIKSEPELKSDGSLGDKVGAWVGNMMGKVATRTWDYATDKAWGFLLNSINAYYRIGKTP